MSTQKQELFGVLAEFENPGTLYRGCEKVRDEGLAALEQAIKDSKVEASNKEISARHRLPVRVRRTVVDGAISCTTSTNKD